VSASLAAPQDKKRASSRISWVLRQLAKSDPTDIHAGRFAGSKTFIEHLEQIVPRFYEQVGQYLRAYVAPPPKPRQAVSKAGNDSGDTWSSAHARDEFDGAAQHTAAN